MHDCYEERAFKHCFTTVIKVAIKVPGVEKEDGSRVDLPECQYVAYGNVDLAFHSYWLSDLPPL